MVKRVETLVNEERCVKNGNKCLRSDGSEVIIRI